MNKTEKKYIRVGSCKRCGRCCKADFLLNACSAKEKELLKKLSGRRNILKDLKGERCKHVWFKKRKARCKIYESRPDFCRAFLTGPNDIVEGCGFSFKEITNQGEENV